jgi:hypothetical protein
MCVYPLCILETLLPPQMKSRRVWGIPIKMEICSLSCGSSTTASEQVSIDG